MRKAQKQELLEALKSLAQAHEEIKEELCRKNSSQIPKIQNMLSECQDFAVSLGECVEKLEGEGHVTVTNIESYCEMLYEIYTEIGIANGNSANENKIYKMLKKQLIKIENSVKSDISVIREIVFLPYKASMWDSMESIYLAAKEDENTRAVVVPISYYEKNPDGSLGTMHYEIDQYPDDIEVVSYEEYCLEKEKPDAIVIHNAYDECNYVTSVHPQFYGKNLKKYTPLLIYTPYFVLGEINAEDENAIENVKHFCFLPGIISADKVILESETVRQIYIEEYRKNARQYGFSIEHTDKKLLEEKFLGLGSAKFDKIVREQKAETAIPQAWMKYILKPDGSRKKIVLYNNSIAALMQRGEDMLEKMAEIFQTFQEFQEEIALWWRPHPLLESTISAMRPLLWKKYQKIVANYKTEDWGIYDDTGELDRAIVAADAYYGDWSSVVHLFKQTGKPIMIVNKKEWSEADEKEREKRTESAK